MTLNELILKYPQLKFLKQSGQFLSLSKERQDFVIGLLEDAMFWIELDSKPNGNDGFKFLAASYGLTNAETSANEMKLEGKDRETFIRPHQDLFTMFNPYSGNGNDSTPKKK